MRMDTQEFKLVLLGGSRVGKSALAIQFIHSCFVSRYDPTIEDSYVKQCVVDNDVAKIEILDTGGDQDFSCLQSQQIKYGQGFLLVFSIIDRQSFVTTLKLHDNILRTNNTEICPLMLVGNKVDLESQRVVSVQEATEEASKRNISYIETSAKTSSNVTHVFHQMIRNVRDNKAGKNTAQREITCKCYIL